MEKVYKRLIIVSLLFASCSNNNYIDITDFDDLGLKNYLSSEREIDVDSYCGFIKDIPVISNDKLFLVDILVECNYYFGDIYIERKHQKIKLPILRAIIKTDSVFFRGEAYSNLEFNFELSRMSKKDSISKILIINEWNNHEISDSFLKSCSNKNFDFIFYYKNKKYYQDYEKYKPKSRVNVTD